jgi:hypothetical protein
MNGALWELSGSISELLKGLEKIKMEHMTVISTTAVSHCIIPDLVFALMVRTRMLP